MVVSSKLLVGVGLILMAAAVILKVMGSVTPGMICVIKPSSLLILANISFVLAVLYKK
jgi:hypothetical protein